MHWHLRDSTIAYGSVSRALHWGMALILVWQFASAAAHLLLEDTAVEAYLWSTHKTVGTLLLVLIVLRVLWWQANRGHRPRPLSVPARLGHLAMYVLMVVVPVLALLRQYGSGRAFAPFGLPLMPGFEGKIPPLIAPANLLHGWLGWLLLVLVVGHIGMTLLHRRRPQDEDVLARMIGSRRQHTAR